MYERSVVAWDGTGAGDRALAWAAGSPFGGQRCTVLRVVRPGAPTADARTAVDVEVARHLAAHPERRMEGEVVAGLLEEELERRSGPATLVVVGTAARADRPPGFRFTVGSRVAARAHGPVAIVPEAAALDPVGPVVVGVDGTAAAFAAVRIGARLAEAARLGLTVVHGWQEIPAPDAGGRFDGEPFGADVARILPQAHRAIGEEVMSLLRDEFPHVDASLLVVHGPAATVLAGAAADASLLVVGKHGRFTSSSQLLGSVAHSVLLTSAAPVLVVGRRDAEARRQARRSAATLAR